MAQRDVEDVAWIHPGGGISLYAIDDSREDDDGDIPMSLTADDARRLAATLLKLADELDARKE